MGERDPLGPEESVMARLGSRSGIWVLQPTPRRLFVFWEIESIWQEQISRHFSVAWNALSYYVMALGRNGSLLAKQVAAEARSVYLDLDQGFEQVSVEWGIWCPKGPHLVILRTAVGAELEGTARWPEFDGYGEARPFPRLRDTLVKSPVRGGL